MMSKRIESYKSSGNVFADIGPPNADAHLMKAQIKWPPRWAAMGQLNEIQTQLGEGLKASAG